MFDPSKTPKSENFFQISAPLDLYIVENTM